MNEFTAKHTISFATNYKESQHLWVTYVTLYSSTVVRVCLHHAWGVHVPHEVVVGVGRVTQ